MQNLLEEGGELYLSERYIPERPLFREKIIEKYLGYLRSFLVYNISGIVLFEGPTGTGKTMSFRFSEKTIKEKLKLDEIGGKIIYINGRDKTAIEVLHSLLTNLGISIPRRGFSFGTYVNELEYFLKNFDGHVHVCIDEIDRVGWRGEHSVEDLLYVLTRNERVSATIITNDFTFLKRIKDPRVRSSISVDRSIVFERYSKEQCYHILKDRCEKAFRKGVVSDSVVWRLSEIIGKESGDIRAAITVLRLAAEIAAERGGGEITVEDINAAWRRFESSHMVEKINALEAGQKLVLAAMYLAMRESGKLDNSSGAIYEKLISLRGRLGMGPIGMDTLRVKLNELEEYGVISCYRRGRGRGAGIERLYRLEIEVQSLLEALKRVPELYIALMEEVKRIVSEKVSVFRETL
jgi:orc1/cdc6 family replication initiation protein